MLVKYADHLKPSKVLSRPHQGTVVDNEDPDKLGRVKCIVKFLYEDESKLPWVYPKHINKRKFSVPKKDDVIMIEFPFNDIYHPYYVGEFYNNDTKEEYFDTDYPNSHGAVFESIKFKTNEETEESEIEHKSGTKAIIKQDGTLEINLAKDVKLTIEGKHEINAKGDIVFTSDANFNVVAKGGLNMATDGSATISGKGGMDISSDASASFVGKGGTTVGSSSSPTNVDGSLVNLAGGGMGIALLGGTALGVGNKGAPVNSTIMEGSSKAFAPK